MNIFCVKCATATKHTGAVSFGELVFTCEVCGHFVKFPQVANREELEALVKEHEDINRPIAESRAKELEQEKILAELIGDKPEEQAEQTEANTEEVK